MLALPGGFAPPPTGNPGSAPAYMEFFFLCYNGLFLSCKIEKYLISVRRFFFKLKDISLFCGVTDTRFGHLVIGFQTLGGYPHLCTSSPTHDVLLRYSCQPDSQQTENAENLGRGGGGGSKSWLCSPPLVCILYPDSTIPGYIIMDDNFTTRKRSCGKVMFLQVSVILFTGGGDLLPGGVPGPGGGACSGGVPGGGCVWSGGMPGGEPPPRGLLLRTVRILLECILVWAFFYFFINEQMDFKLWNEFSIWY